MRKNAAKVTIGLPVYNGADYLDAALETLCAQDFKDLRILISDNASTDSTPEIIAKWAAKDKRITSFRQSENIGAARNYRYVIDNADSEFFIYGAHDDLWSPQFVSSLYNAMMTGDYILAAPQLITIYADGREHIHKPFAEGLLRPQSKVNLTKLALRKASSAWYYGLWRKDAMIAALNDMTGFTHLWAADYVVLLPAILAGRVTGSNEAIYYKRETPLSDARYRPRTSAAQYAQYRDFVKEGLRVLKLSHFSCWQRMLLVKPLLRFASHGVKPKRMVKTWLKEQLARLKA